MNERRTRSALNTVIAVAVAVLAFIVFSIILGLTP